MKKIYLVTLCIFYALATTNAQAQAPAFRYTNPSTFTVGKAITPINPAISGGAVPNEVFSKTITVAGTGYYGYKDTLALFSTFQNPVSSAIDSKGNIYVADANLNAIRKISAAGLVSTLAGPLNGEKGKRNGKDTSARFNYPTGIAVDAADNVYVADFGNSLIRKIFPDGTVTTFAGNINSGSNDGLGSAAQFNFPYSIVFDASGNLLVADTYNNKIRKITPAGLVTTIAGTGAAGFNNGPVISATFKAPKGIAVDLLGNIYVTEEDNNSVRKIIPNSIVSTFAVTPFIRPIGITTDKQNHVYVSSQDKFNIYRFNADGSMNDPYPAFSGGDLKDVANGTDTLTKYRGGMGLTYDGDNNILIADPLADYVRKVAVNGYRIYPRLPTGLSLDGTGAITGTPTGVSPKTVYTITAYNNSGSSTATVSITVGIAAQTITFAAIPPPKYGVADFSPGAISTNETIPIIYTSSNLAVATIVDGKVHVVGAGTTNIVATQEGNVNYTIAAPKTRALVVNKADLTITSDDKIRTIGKDNPTLTVSFSGFVNGETSTVLKTQPTAQTSATPASAVDYYPITASGADADNYSITYVAGNLRVFPVPEISSTGSTNIVKGGSVLLSASPATGYTYQWYFNGVEITGATAPNYTAKETGGYSVNITSSGYTSYSLYTPVIALLQLPADNFKVQLNGVTCKGSNDGSITITAVQKLKYSAVVTGNGLNTPYAFTDNLNISNLSPGSYSVCLSVDNEVFSQCYQLNVVEPKDLSVFSTINKTLNTVNLQLDGGNTFNIILNNVNYTTSQSEITLPLVSGINKLQITTDKICQGFIEKTIDVNMALTPYPNPFTGVLSVNIGTANIKNMQADITNVRDGKSVYKNKYNNQSGVVQFDLSGLDSGVYYLNLNLDNKELGYKIIKK